MSTRSLLDRLLERIVNNDQLHAKCLNSFSYLEYLGFRKILRTANSAEITSYILLHAVEEGRHALLLKKLAIRIGGATFDSYAPEFQLFPVTARTYIGALEREIGEKGVSKRLCYLYVTWLVELRALQIYSVYSQLKKALPLSGLLADEKSHLCEVEKYLQDLDPSFHQRSRDLTEVEEIHYVRFLDELEQSIATRVGHVAL